MQWQSWHPHPCHIDSLWTCTSSRCWRSSPPSGWSHSAAAFFTLWDDIKNSHDLEIETLLVFHTHSKNIICKEHNKNDKELLGIHMFPIGRWLQINSLHGRSGKTTLELIRHYCLRRTSRTHIWVKYLEKCLTFNAICFKILLLLYFHPFIVIEQIGQKINNFQE